MRQLCVRRFGISALVLVALSMVSGQVLAFDPAAHFMNKCSSCHGIGTGDDVGPDLKGLPERRSMDWIVKFVQGSQGVIASGDPVAVELFAKFRNKKMPDMELSKEEIVQLVEFIKVGKLPEKKADAKSALDAKPEEILAGENYFIGKLKLQNGGPACISCHNAGLVGTLGGGALGPDLTNVYSSYKDKGLSKALAKIAFPTMVGIYENHELTDEEAFKIKAFLYVQDQSGVTPSGYQKKFTFLGIIGLLLILGAIDLSYRKRRTETIRRYVRRKK